MADGGLERLGADHVSWLNVAADNFLRQRRAERAAALLELACLLAPDDAQSRTLLAYAHLRRGDGDGCAAALARARSAPLSDADRAAVELLERRLAGAAARGGRA